MTTVSEILKRLRLKQLSVTLRVLLDFKGRQVEAEYQKTIST
jgi:hypothetical protein